MFWVDNPDVTMPRIAFFSQKSIAKGEELTFDYRMSGKWLTIVQINSVFVIKECFFISEVNGEVLSWLVL